MAEAYKKFLTPNIKEYLNELSNITGKKMENTIHVSVLHDTLEVEVRNQITFAVKKSLYYFCTR